MLPVAREEFLPDWEEVERRATGARGVARELVRDVRDTLSDAQIALVGAVADAYLVRRQPAKAIPTSRKVGRPRRSTATTAKVLPGEDPMGRIALEQPLDDCK
jgi:hypothetical protein